MTDDEITGICDKLAEGKSLRASIYGLFDKDGGLRYIGKANDPAKRLKGHMRETTRRRTPLYDWLAKHGLPDMKILEADCADWREAERRLIASARSRGERLLNLADGGDEPHCPTEVRARNGAATAKAIQTDPLNRRVWKLKLDIGALLKAGYLTNESRAKLRYAAAKRPELFGCYAGIEDRIEHV